MKTIKTAGTSVEAYFEKYCLPEGEWAFKHARDESICAEGIIGYRGADPTGKRFFNHMIARQLKDELGVVTWDDYFKFTVVRNPFDKLVSAFFHFEKYNNPAYEQSGDAGDIGRFREWVRDGGKVVDRGIYTIDGDICVDYIIRYEDLEEGIREVCRRIDVPFVAEDLPRLKSGIRDTPFSLRDFYDSDTEQLARELYAFELEQFGYSLP